MLKARDAFFPLCTLVAFGLLGCQDLPESAIRGYRATPAPNQAADLLQGTWKSACSNGEIHYLYFVNRQVSEVTQWFSDSACSSTNPQYSLTIGKDFTFATTDETSATQVLNTSVAAGLFTVGSGNSTQANTDMVCGLSNWQDSTSVDVTGKTCLSISVPTVGTTGTSTVVITSDAESLTYNGTPYDREKNQD